MSESILSICIYELGGQDHRAVKGGRNKILDLNTAEMSYKSISKKLGEKVATVIVIIWKSNK